MGQPAQLATRPARPAQTQANNPSRGGTETLTPLPTSPLPPSRSDLDRDRSRAPDASHRHTHRASILLRDATSPAHHLPASSSLSRLDMDRGKPPQPRRPSPRRPRRPAPGERRLTGAPPPPACFPAARRPRRPPRAPLP